MLDKTNEQKIRGFMSDVIMSKAVKNVLREAFLKTSGNNDVQTLAAERIAINLLEDGFKELKKYSKRTEKQVNTTGQVGL